jgi:hypothetical protein
LGESIDRFDRVRFSCSLLSVEEPSYRLWQGILEVVRRQCSWLVYHLAIVRQRTSATIAVSRIAILATQLDLIACYCRCTLELSQRSGREEIILSDRINVPRA